MEHLIRFRLLADSLSHNEFSEMLQDVHKAFGENIFIKALFYYFNQQNDSNTNTNDMMIQTNDILKNIIHSRNVKKDKKIKKQKQKLTFNILPSPLISFISSHLLLSEYIKFERTNRYIFTSCRIHENGSISIKSIMNNNNNTFWINKYTKHCELYST
eukprot:219313_1